MALKNKYLVYVFLFLIFIIALFYRINGLSKNNPPFWVDEFSSANQGQLFLKYGLNILQVKDIVIEKYNITTHLLISLSYKLFGVNELAARLPSIVVGALVPLAVFLLAKKLFDLRTAIAASLLTVFSYIEILWSRQARGYVILQFLTLLAFYFYLKLIEDKKHKTINSVLFVLVVFLGIITHQLFFLVVLSIIIHFLIFYFSKTILLIKKPFSLILLILFTLVSFKLNFAKILAGFGDNFYFSNNLWYYHSFLWREYGLVTFSALIGILVGIFSKKKPVVLFVLYLGILLIFLSFVLKPYASKYILSIFPILFLFMAYFISTISANIFRSKKSFLISTISIFITIFILLNGYKFVSKPQKYYSLNRDFREIANINYNEFYSIIKKGSNLYGQNIVIIDPWWDRAYWYLGNRFKDNIVSLRWFNERGQTNGLSRYAPYYNGKRGEKYLLNSNLRLVLEKKDLILLIKEYPRGFLFIDDVTLPKDVRDFAKKNLKKELYLDHYPLDDNPYSIWPATLYSWGIK